MIRWTAQASEDFTAIRDYIASDSLSAAIRQCDLIASSIEQLDRFPQSGPKSTVGKLRELYVPQTPYIIFYRFQRDAVILIGILHGAMRRPKRLRR